ncbi:MAG TPA: NTF2 fold immunity protein [Gammaproteobacteria bacterium]
MWRKILFLSLLCVTGVYAAEPEDYSYKPKNGFIPDEETAIAVAVAVWKPIYGVAQIKHESPFVAKLKDGVWYVSGSLPEGWAGGVAEAEISKADGTILRISHGK